jgi:hypothetical protein
MDEFQKEHGPTLRPSTVRRYGVSIDHLDAFLGDKLLLSVRSSDLKDFETAPDRGRLGADRAPGSGLPLDGVRLRDREGMGRHQPGNPVPAAAGEAGVA